jgi:multiple sugar transport system permease protein
MLFISIIVIFPFIWLFITSFKLEKDIVTWPPKLLADSYTLNSYLNVFRTIPLFSFIKNTVIFAGGVVISQLLLDSMAAYALARLNFKGRKLFSYLILLAMMIPFQVYMIPLFFLVHFMGLLDTYAGLIIPRMVMPYGIFLMRASFVSLPKDLEEAARIDGLSEIGIFFKIMLPLVKPGLVTLAVIILMNNWNDLLYPMMLTSNPQMRTLSAGLALFTGENIQLYGPVLAGTVISILPLLLVYALAQKYFVIGVATSGMKE